MTTMGKPTRHASAAVVQWRLAAFLAGASALVLLAVAASRHLARQSSAPTDQGCKVCKWTDPATLPDLAPATNPAEAATRPMDAIGLELLREEPEDFYAPAGAVRLYAVRKKTPGGAADVAAYTTEVDADDVENFYRARLTQAGYKLVRRAPGMQPGGVSLVFLRQPQQSGRLCYCVNLRPAGKGKNKTRITLVVDRPDR